MRCVCVTPNASVDTTYRVDHLARGSSARVLERISVPGGKGNNVARILRALGHDVVASGFAAGGAGEFVERELWELGVAPAFVRIPGESRTCLAIIENEARVATELLEPGPRVTEEAAAALVERVAGLADDADAVVLSGSLPTDAPADLYARLIHAVRATGVFVVLDTSGSALVEGMQGGPDLVKPNWDELTALAGLADPDLHNGVSFVQDRLLQGPLSADASVLLSLGKDGAVLIDADGAIHLPAPAAAPVNPVGAGDAMLAGYLDAWSRGESGEAALTWASAVAGASTRQPVAGRVDPLDIEHLMRTTGAAVPLDSDLSTNRGHT
jgi:tagatose 6-phosphate kinase